MSRMPATDVEFPDYIKTPIERKVYSELEYVWHSMVWRHFPSGLTGWQRKTLVAEVVEAIRTAQRIKEHDLSQAGVPCEGVKESIAKTFGNEHIDYRKTSQESHKDGCVGPALCSCFAPQDVSREFRGKAIAENLAAQFAIDPRTSWPVTMKGLSPEKDMVNLPAHYADWEIEPIRFIVENKIGWCEANIIKYVMRWKLKNGWEDLEKVLSYSNLLMAFEDGDPEWWTINKRRPLKVPQYLKQGRASGGS